MNITELKGKRCLLQVSTGRFRGDKVDEFKVLEIAPSGNWVKLQNINGNKFWKPVVEVAFVEELKDLRAGRPDSES